MRGRKTTINAASQSSATLAAKPTKYKRTALPGFRSNMAPLSPMAPYDQMSFFMLYAGPSRIARLPPSEGLSHHRMNGMLLWRGTDL